ncbi:hypothetical protein [Streptococcus sp. Marseille-Q8145]
MMPDNTYKFINPYTFLSIKDEAPNRTNLRKGSLSGRIHCKLSIESPTFIPNTSKTFEEKFDKDTLKGQDFFSYQDLSQESKFPLKAPEQPRIPGSEIRGMIRNVYEQLTNSCLSVIDEKMQVIISKQPGLWNRKTNIVMPCDRAEISQKIIERKKYKNLKDYCRPEASYATGYVVFEEDSPRTESESFFYFKKNYQEFKQNGKIINLYRAGTQQIEDIQKENSLPFFFVQTDDMLMFKKVLEEYGKTNEPAHVEYKAAYHNINEYPLLPVYYAHVDNALYMSPACITSEVFYHTFSNILRENHSGHQPCDGAGDQWCPACCLFGKIGQDGEGHALASRLRFCDSEPIRKAELEAPLVLPILGEPHYSATEFYLQAPKDKDVLVWNYEHYIEVEASDATEVRQLYTPRLAGRKVYWLGQDTHAKDKDNKNNYKMRNKVRCLTKGNCEFDIFFEDVTEEELKLLLWCIRLEPDSDCFHRIGRGKPFGMGKVKIIVEGLDEITYSLDENHKLKRNTRDIKSDYEGISYSDEQKAIMKHLSSYMKVINDTIDYPRLEENGPIYEWFANNKGKNLGKVYIREILAPYPETGVVSRDN